MSPFGYLYIVRVIKMLRITILNLLLFILVGPATGVVIFFMFFGINPANEVILPFAIIGGVFVGMPPAIITGIAFYPAFLIIKKLLKSSSQLLIASMTGGLLGSTITILFFILTGNHSIHIEQINILLIIVCFVPGAVCGYLSGGLILSKNHPNKSFKPTPKSGAV